MFSLGKFIGDWLGKFRPSPNEVDTNVLVLKSLEVLNESVAEQGKSLTELKESVAESLTELKESVTVLTKLGEKHGAQLTAISNNLENVARTNEDEIGQGAVNYFESLSCRTVTDVHWRRKFGEPGNQFEIDCLIVMNDALAVVEVKSSVNSAVFTQLRNTAMKVRSCEELYREGQEKEIILVVGAPNFPPPLRAKALKSGITIIQFSGVGYEVRGPPERGTDKVSLDLI